MEQPRSTFVTVVAWIFIVFSGMGLLEFVVFALGPFGRLFTAQLAAQSGPQPPPALILSIVHVVMLVGVVVTAWVLISAIGLLLRKNWARISFIVILILGIGFSIVYMLLGIVGALGMHNLPASAESPPDVQAVVPFMVGAMLIFGLIFVGLYSWILVMLFRKKIRAEFQPGAPEN